MSPSSLSDLNFASFPSTYAKVWYEVGLAEQRTVLSRQQAACPTPVAIRLANRLREGGFLASCFIAHSRLTLYASVRSFHSPSTLSRPRSWNWVKPIHFLMVPKTGPAVCFRNRYFRLASSCSILAFISNTNAERIWGGSLVSAD